MMKSNTHDHSFPNPAKSGNGLMDAETGIVHVAQSSGQETDDDKSHKTVPALATTQHLGSGRQYWRDIILGVNDGIISTFLLVAGVSGGGLTSIDILLTAIAGALAGAVSMFAGEFVATKSQNEVMKGEIKLEKQHIELYMDDEIDEMRDLLSLIGLSKEEEPLKEDLLRYYRNNPQSLLQAMIALEFGVIEEEKRKPLSAGLVSGGLFLIGSLPAIIPFTIASLQTWKALVMSAVFTALALTIVGAIKTWATKGSCLGSSLENLGVAGFGGLFAYAVGLLFEHYLRP